MSETTTMSYFDQRMIPLGLTPENNTIKLWQFSAVDNENCLEEFPVFSETELGIKILVYTIDRLKITIEKGDSRFKTKDYALTRLEHPKVKPNGDVQKYDIPKGIPTMPFFPPKLIDKYDSKEKIKVLYITEGYFKAFMASLHGIDCVGVPSITCLKNKETNKLHGDIVKLLKRNEVERVVWLTDGDCLNIGRTQFLTEPTNNVYTKELTQRPRMFFNSISTFYDLCSDIETVKPYFAHINSENIVGKPKGLDDLLMECPDQINDIISEMNAFDKMSAKKYSGNYIVKFDISIGNGYLTKYFMFNDVTQFYLYHLERNPELKGRQFKFYGTQYGYNEAEGVCEIVVPKSASDYFRVGDKYYKYVGVPDRYGEKISAFHRREAKTITDDHGKDIFKHIPKYEAFCVVPDHMNYQRVIDGCFNLYAPFEHEIEDGDFEVTMEFIKHIFGEDEVKYYDHETKKEIIYKTYELGLDYLTLLYKKPQHILPILCLVSKERSTGKTTFAKWLNLIFSENMAVVGNDDLEAQFNAHWSSKLIICCDETKIDKHKVIERVKSLSTASSIMMNAKGKDQVNMEFFGKFIFLSNNEENFINIDGNEIRFWIHKVPVIKKKDVDLIESLIDEIPAFLSYLSKRSVQTLKRERHWFDNELLKTDALHRVVKNSLPGVQKTINAYVAYMFEEFEDQQVLTLPFSFISEVILKKKFDEWYVRKVIREMELELQPTQKRSYPKMKEEYIEGQGLTRRAESVTFHGRYYEFHRNQFITDVEEKIEEKKDDLPF